MGVRFPTAAGSSTGNAVGNIETVVALLTMPAQPFDFGQILLFWYYATTIPASTTVCQVRLRRGNGTGGTLIVQGTPSNVTAGGSAVFSGCASDSPGAIAGQQYSLTAQFTSAGATAGPVEASILALCL